MDLSNNEQIEREIVELRKHVKTYRPGEESRNVFRRNEVLFPEHLFIGLFGRTGCGKTSLINSLKFTVSGPTRKGKWLPVANTEKAGAHTLKRVQAHLKGNVSVIDNRGADDLTEEGLLDEVKAQMDGKRGYSQEIKWHNPRGSDDEDEFIDVNNKVGCAVFVFSALDDIDQSTKGLHHVVHFLQAEQGPYPVAVITHVDVVVERQLVDTLRSNLKVTGISEIFEVANITDVNEELEIRYQHNLLSLLERCMTDGDEAAVFKHYQQKEQVAKQQKKEQRKREEKQVEEKKQRREEEHKRYEQEQRSQNYQDKKIAVLSGGLITGATAAGATVGMILGPVGSVIGAGVGAGIGAGVGVVSLVIGKVVADA